MKIKLDNLLYQYIFDTLLFNRKDLLNSMKVDKSENYILVELSDENAIQIRDLAGQKLQEKGFDKNYDLTEEGKILERIEDLFFS